MYNGTYNNIYYACIFMYMYVHSLQMYVQTVFFRLLVDKLNHSVLIKLELYSELPLALDKHIQSMTI